VLSVLSCAEIL